MASWATVGFQIGFRSIERAYRESLEAFDREIAEWMARFAEHEAAVRAGEVEEEQDGYDFGEHVGEHIFEAEQGQRLVREAFALILYHFWEREACSLLGLGRYEQRAAFKAAQADPRFQVDEVGLHRLRLIANCIKHDNGLPLHAEAPGLFNAELVPAGPKAPGWQTALDLKDTDLAAAFTAVKASGPLRSDDAIEDV